MAFTFQPGLNVNLKTVGEGGGKEEGKSIIE